MGSQEVQECHNQLWPSKDSPVQHNRPRRTERDKKLREEGTRARPEGGLPAGLEPHRKGCQSYHPLLTSQVRIAPPFAFSTLE